jgi:hypothetical protein
MINFSCFAAGYTALIRPYWNIYKHQNLHKMKNLELSERKNTTENAKKAVIDLMKSFDFSKYTDISYVESKHFALLFKPTPAEYKHNSAYFVISEGEFKIHTYDSEIGDNWESIKVFGDVSDIFDYTCIFICFPAFILAIEDFITKINAAVSVKETQIADFLEYVEGWKSYQETIRVAKEVEGKEEII